MLELNLRKIKDKIAGRANLLAVSKGRSADEIAELYALGQRDFGENYALEMKEKQHVLSKRCSDIRWHFIGQIQTNKARIIASSFMVHSVSSLKHAQVLARFVVDGKKLPILIQINFDKAIHRGGIAPENLSKLKQEIKSIPNLELRGLMTVLPLHGVVTDYFAQMRDLRGELPELSMGMSADFESALAYESTWIRIGRALFQK